MAPKGTTDGSVALVALALSLSGAMWPGAQAAAAQEVGEAFRDCDVCPEMVVVPGGRFTMGSPETEEERAVWEWSQREVSIGYAFAVGVYEVVFEEWDACVRAGGCGRHEPDDEGWGRGRRPVINVNWDDAWQYADWLTEQTGEEYRLLSEAEWEYVARAGTRTARYWGETAQQQCSYANGFDCFGLAETGFDFMETVGCRDRQRTTAPAGSFQPNPFGLYDVLGNVSERVDDCWNQDHDGAPTDGTPWYTGDCSSRVYRGGSWLTEPGDLRSAFRLYTASDTRRRDLGFRVARRVQ